MPTVIGEQRFPPPPAGCLKANGPHNTTRGPAGSICVSRPESGLICTYACFLSTTYADQERLVVIPLIAGVRRNSHHQPKYETPRSRLLFCGYAGCKLFPTLYERSEGRGTRIAWLSCGPATLKALVSAKPRGRSSQQNAASSKAKHPQPFSPIAPLEWRLVQSPWVPDGRHLRGHACTRTSGPLLLPAPQLPLPCNASLIGRRTQGIPPGASPLRELF